ncbi:MAG: A/G-specific adenine glycosylase [Gammaproteobacteria bacterium]
MNLKKITTPTTFQKLVLTWFDSHGRKDLPWQHDKTPYRVWISEIMLQQTQVVTVIPYFQRFIARFPDVQSLAFAKEDDVLHLWTGLGYYNRARNLHRTAKSIAENFQGKFPADLEELQSLPGIGRSTAGAILAIAFQQRAAILDGNVKRVLTRFHAIKEWSGEKNTAAALWEITEKLTPNNRVADYTQAMMDMGATVCIRGKPHCDICPLQKLCLARQLGIEKTLPRAKPKKILPIRQATLLILQNANCVLLEKRPPVGIWGGLWSLPEIINFTDEDAIHAVCRQRFQIQSNTVKLDEPFRHTFSHFHLDILPALVTLKTKPRKIMDSEQRIWYNLQQSQEVGLPAPVKKLLRNLS